MGRRIRDYDWSATPLGLPETWPQSLRTCIRIMLTSRQPIWIGWGRQLIKFYNDPYKQIVGGKHPWALGKPASVVWKDVWRVLEPMLQQVMEKDEGTYVESQLLIMERNGYPEETYYTFSYTPIPGDDGKTGGMFCANTDDTDKIISERQLMTLTRLGKQLTDCRSNEEIIRKTISTLKENPFDFPFALFYTLSGNRAEFSYSTSLGGSANAIPQNVDMDSGEGIAPIIRQAIDTGKPQIVDRISEGLDELPRGAWEIASDKMIVLPIVQTGLNPHGVLIVGLNPYRLFEEKYQGFFSLISDQVATSFADVHVLDEERKRAEALAEIDRAKTTFFSNISHEFRTPLTLILGPIDDMLHDPDTIPANRTRMRVAFRNALRMQKLVNTLLEFSRIEAGRMEGQFRKVNICAFTRELASTFRSAIEKAGMQLIFDGCEVTDDVYVDPDMWEKIVFNLLSNAFKYTTGGAISIVMREKNKEVQLSVADTGIGIAEHQLDKIFDRFHRIENIQGRSQEGTGIGLAMVKELVKMHSGSIKVTSQVGKGSVFTVSIPTGSAHLPADKIIDAPEPDTIHNADAYVHEAMKWIADDESGEDGQHADADKMVATGSMPRYTVLLADDNADMRDYVRRLLEDQFEVITASNGEQAFTKMLKYKPDLLLSDIMMPVLDGFGLLKKVRNEPEIRSTPVIFLSARAGEEAEVEGLDAGADDYLIKPFSARELLVRVANHIRINEVRRETERQFYQLFLQAPAIINILKGPEFRYVLYHPYNRKFFGNRDLTGLTLKETMPELEEQGIRQLLNQVFHEGATITENERRIWLRDPLGELIDYYFNITYQPWYDLRNQIQGVMTFAIEVTEAVKSRKKIEESEEQFRTLAETLPQLVWMGDASGAQLYASSNWKEYTGLEAVPQTWNQIVHPDDLAHINSAWDHSRSTGEPYKIEVRLKSKTGEYRWFYGQALPIYSREGEIINWIGAFTDIHDQKETELNLEELVSERTLELQRSNEDLQQFAHVASHDLKEPLRKIKTFLNRLVTEYGSNIPGKGQNYIERIQSAADRMDSMINGVLTYSSIAASDQQIEKVDLNEVLNNVVTDLELLIQQKQATIRLGELPAVEGASVLFYQLFYNLINNSLKFSRKDMTAIITVRWAPMKGSERIKIELEDNGIGFEQQYADRIFETFSRLHSKDQYEGTGLGLALCKKIVLRHGGDIYATSREGDGSTFTIVLPVQQDKKYI